MYVPVSISLYLYIYLSTSLSFLSELYERILSTEHWEILLIMMVVTKPGSISFRRKDKEERQEQSNKEKGTKAKEYRVSIPFKFSRSFSHTIGEGCQSLSRIYFVQCSLGTYCMVLWGLMFPIWPR